MSIIVGLLSTILITNRFDSFMYKFFFLSLFRFNRKSHLQNEFLYMVPRDQKDILDHEDIPVHQEGPVHREVLDPRDLPAQKVLLDPRALQGRTWNVTGNNVFTILTTRKTMAYSW